jgi:hypothetical protein
MNRITSSAEDRNMGEKNRGLSRARLASMVRAVYIQQRQQHDAKMSGVLKEYRPGAKWDGGSGSDGRTYLPIWPKITQRLLDEEINPIRAVFALFAACDTQRDSPAPNWLLSPKWLERLRAPLSEDDVDRIRSAVQSEKDQLTTYLHSTLCEFDDMEMSKTDKLLMALTNAKAGWSPLLRYALAVREKLPLVAKQFKDAATLQYLMAIDVYNELYGDMIPKELRDVGRQIKAVIDEASEA